MSRRDIAAHLGMAPETLTRTFAELERKEIIEVVADGVVFLDVKESPGRGKKPALGTQDSYT
jgi:DNA-binding transcriptional regulator YhcF (GntR family)